MNNLVYDGMRLDITVEKAIRKFNRTNSNPGIVIATCKTLKDKESVMNSKKELKRSRKYENAFIEHDIPLQQRKLNSNLRAIVNTIGQDKLYFRGSHVLRSESQNHYSERRDDRDKPELRRYHKSRNYNDRRRLEGRQESGYQSRHYDSGKRHDYAYRD